jgi:hypothetical protein
MKEKYELDTPNTREHEDRVRKYARHNLLVFWLLVICLLLSWVAVILVNAPKG